MQTNQPQLNTDRSDTVAQNYARRQFVAPRRTLECARSLPAPPEVVFDQLCPTREHDWIDGWASDLIYSESGYAEDLCVFRTGSENVSGPGVWIFSHWEPPRLVKIVRLLPHLVIHLSVEVSDNGDGTSETRWSMVITALDEQGGEYVNNIPADEEEVLSKVVSLLAHFLETGQMQRQPDGGAGTDPLPLNRLAFDR